MKTTIKRKDYGQVVALKTPKHKLPRKPNIFWRGLIRFLTMFGMAGTRFHYEAEGLEELKKEPCLILMNHSCFLDMQIAHRILFPKHFCIVSTYDGLIGMGGFMEWLMRSIGCIPTQKFVTDMTLIQDMTYALKTLKTSVLMYPEAGYSFDGTATTLPRKLGILLKKLDVPVIMIESFGAYSRNPLYNELQVRKNVPVCAKARCLFTREQVRQLPVSTLTQGVEDAFAFDQFRWQQEQGIVISDDFRADGLHRILYKCADCGAEGQMEGKGIHLTCHACGKKYVLKEDGSLEATEGETQFSHIPDYYEWERGQVRAEILEGKYCMDTDVEIGMLVDFKAIYMVGEGHLTHTAEGFTLTGCDGRLHYTQKPQVSHSLNADFYFYEIGDVIGIGNAQCLYYCFPKTDISVAKTRLATEELYKLSKAKRLSTESVTV